MRSYFVSDVIVDEEMNPVVILAPCHPSGRVRELVPVWVGVHEAALISIALHGDRSPRPLTHDLIEDVLAALDSTVERVEIRLGASGLFDAALTIGSASGRIVLECRPADALALAVRADVPTQLDEAVIRSCGVAQELEAAPADEDEVDARVAAFRRFIDESDPRDFRR